MNIKREGVETWTVYAVQENILLINQKVFLHPDRRHSIHSVCIETKEEVGELIKSLQEFEKRLK